MPGAPYNMQSANCCKGGVLTSMTQDASKLGTTFQMNYIKASVPLRYLKGSNFTMPKHFTFGIPGYTCGIPFQVPPSLPKMDTVGNKFWVSTSLAFTSMINLHHLHQNVVSPCLYSTIVSLSLAPHAAVIAKGYQEPIVSNDIGMLWGLHYYKDMWLAHGDNGNVQIEVLLRKDAGEFSFKDGWTFPRKILFNGDECVMPSPDTYPRLPNTAHVATKSPLILLFSIIILLPILF
ncbi:hypothetical protein RJT34_13234 [Clitoria ternatea]|uniref:COBRA C-terminal domain-containing protein n=1 Tax=Clitoria ternatea TaxID=43366 RepID=A0AAN9JR65_CLITE